MKTTLQRPAGEMSDGGILAARIICGLLLLALFVLGTVIPVIDMEHYVRASKNPVVVTATVTAHKAYDDEGDTDFYSKISYTVDGVLYENVTYEDKDTRNALTPIGEQVTVKVSPEDHGTRIDSLLPSGRFLVIMAPVLMFVPACLVYWIIGWQRSRVYQKSTVKRDLKLTILRRYGICGWPMAGLGYGLILWRYPVVTGTWTVVATAACGILWLISIRRAIRDLRIVNAGEYQVRRDEVVKKETSEDSDGGTIYRIYYGSGGRRWDTCVNWKKFYTTSEGDVVYSLYLPGMKKPLYHYEWAIEDN